MEESIEFISNVTKQDLKAFHYNHFKKSKPLIILRYFLLSPIILYSFSYYLNRKIPSIIELLTILVFIILAVYLPSIFAYLRTNINVKNNKLINKNIQYSINTESIYSKSDLHESTVSWKNIYKVEETKTLIILYMDKILGVVIPKRHLTENQLFKLRKTITQLELKYIS